MQEIKTTTTNTYALYSNLIIENRVIELARERKLYNEIKP